MSILLDALKKSEEQRQLGKVPDIHSPIGTESMAAAGRRRWVLLLLVGGVALSAAWFAWEKFRQSDPPAGPARDTAGAVESPPDAAPEAVVSSPRASTSDEAPPGKPPAARRTPVETMAPAGADTLSPATQVPADSQQDEPQKSRVNESFTAFEADPAAAPKQPKPKQAALADAQRRAAVEAKARARAAAVAVPRQAPAEAQQQAQAKAQQQAPVEAQQQAPVEAQQRAPAEPGAATVAVPRQTAAVNEQAAQPQPPVTEPISFWELPQGVRDTLPELRITVLVYAERPEDRFLLLGGQRLQEKDEYQGGVVLDEIRRDGAVFLYSNYRFLVKG